MRSTTRRRRTGCTEAAENFVRAASEAAKRTAALVQGG